MQIVRPPYVVVTDEDLRHRALTGAHGELDARLVVVRDVHLLVRHVLLLQQALCPISVRAPRRGVDGDGFHRLNLETPRLAAIDDDAGARHPTRSRADQEGDDVADFLGRPEAPEANLALDESADRGRVALHAAVPGGARMQHAARRDREYTDAAR